MTPITKSKIFISYSRRENGLLWKERLIDALKVFEQQHLLDVWHDEEMALGEDWHNRIIQSMLSAKLSVLLLTDEMLKSPFVLQHEFPELQRRYREEGLIIAPILCEKCNWKDNDWLASLQIKPRVATDPTPLAALSERELNSALSAIATEIAEQISHMVLTALSTPDKSPSPDDIYLDKFPLTSGAGVQKEKLIGREQELALLDLAFAQGQTAITTLVAWGGVGKTMLVQHWLKRLERGSWHGVRRVYGWSFYSQGTTEDRQASEDTFLAHALEWFGVECEPTLSPWDKGRLLAQAIANKPTLLILDGIEPLQYPPGPMGGQLRAPGVQSLLKHLARNVGSIAQPFICLVTTREPLTDLSDFERRPEVAWGSVLRLDLGNLNDYAGAALLHHAGVKRAGAAEIEDNDTELRAASHEVDGHALTLNLLGRFLARAYEGDIRRRDLVKFEEADKTVQGGTTFKMLTAFENWFANEGDIEARALAILRILGLFDRPADSGCLSALREPPVISGLTEPLFVLKQDSQSGQISERALSDKAWNDAVHFISDFGLIAIQTVKNQSKVLVDCHPLIREYFEKKLNKNFDKSWQEAHRRLYEHLMNSTEKFPNSLEGLQPLYQAVKHGCSCGEYHEALIGIYRDRILRGHLNFSSSIGGVSSDLGAISCFFEKPWETFRYGFRTDGYAWLLNEAAWSLKASGRLFEAVTPYFKSLELNCEIESWDNASDAAIGLTYLLLNIGETPRAKGTLQQCFGFTDKSDDWSNQLIALTTLAHVLCQIGQSELAAQTFQLAEKFQQENQPQFHLLHFDNGFYYCMFLLGGAERSAWRKVLGHEIGSHERNDVVLSLCNSIVGRANSGLKLTEEFINYAQSSVSQTYTDYKSLAMDHLSIGNAMFFACIISGAEMFKTDQKWSSHLKTAVDCFRRSNQQDMLPLGLLARSFLLSLNGDNNGSQSDLDEAWDIASRGPMRLHMADIHLYRARLFFREEHYPWESPRADLEAAEKLINECGYHRRDEELADAKRVILGL